MNNSREQLIQMDLVKEKTNKIHETPFQITIRIKAPVKGTKKSYSYTYSYTYSYYLRSKTLSFLGTLTIFNHLHLLIKQLILLSIEETSLRIAYLQYVS